MNFINREPIDFRKTAIWNFVCLGIVVVLLGLTPGFSEAGSHKQIEQTVTRATLANGLQVVIVRNPIASVVSTVVNYRVGSNEAPVGFPGMAHAQEHMMFRGNPDLTECLTPIPSNRSLNIFSPYQRNTWTSPCTSNPFE